MVALFVCCSVVLLVIIVVMVVRNKSGELVEDVSADKSNDKTGIYSGFITLKDPSLHYIDVNRKFHYTAKIVLKSNYGNDVLVKFTDIISSDYPTNKLMSGILYELNLKHRLVKKSDVVWENDTPDLLLSRDNLRVLLNTGKLVKNKVEIKIDESIDRSELLDIVIQETND